MELPIIERGQRKLVRIDEGHVFLLPGRIPHAPQRPVEQSFGLVIERRRQPHELDGLRWYSDFAACAEVSYEEHFFCADLGRDLVPVVQRYKAWNLPETRDPATGAK